MKYIVNNQNSFLRESYKIHGNIYDYSLTIYNTKDKNVKIICSKHGVFEQTPRSHLKGRGCPHCSKESKRKRESKTLECFIEKSKELHGDKYDYSLVDYTNTYTNVKIGCPIHGVYEQSPKSHLRGHGCNVCEKERRQQVCHLRYTQQQFIDLSNQKHGNKYDYSLTEYTNSRTKVKIICTIHGEFEQIPATHLRGNGCKQCFNERSLLSQDQFVFKATTLHKNKYQYGQYTGTSEKIQIICPKHGEFAQIANNHLQGSGCPKCSDKINSQENLLSDLLTDIGLNVVRQSYDVISPYQLDIYIPDKYLGIEFNGNMWHSEKYGRGKNYHLMKTELCHKLGIRLIHIFEDQWIFKKDIVISRVLTSLGFCKKKIHARKCKIRKITNIEARDFLNRTHIQGYVPSKHSFGLFYNDVLVMCMTFGKTRFSKSKTGRYELLRMSSDLNTIIVGGASKLFSHFIKAHHPDEIISYCDKGFNIGGVYKKLGFDYSHSSSPNYKYFHLSNTKKTYSRIQFQKHKLKDKLEHFDPTLSEWENMKANGYNRIWDCGNDVYIWKC